MGIGFIAQRNQHVLNSFCPVAGDSILFDRSGMNAANASGTRMFMFLIIMR